MRSQIAGVDAVPSTSPQAHVSFQLCIFFAIFLILLHFRLLFKAMHFLIGVTLFTFKTGI